MKVLCDKEPSPPLGSISFAPWWRQEWETDHSPNMTGTTFAYRPKGALREGGERRQADADYEAWDPNA